MKISPLVALSVLGLVSFSGSAFAVRAPQHLAGRPSFELFSSSPTPRDATPRGLPGWDAPRGRARAAMKALQADLGASWRASFDPKTGVPSRLYGAGVAAPGSMADGKAAEAFAKGVLSRHLALLAPGASASDFELVSNDLDAGIRTLGFAQRHGGLRVQGGQVSFRFKNDRLFVIGSEALPNVHVGTTPSAAPVASLSKAALTWVEADFGASSVGAVSDAFILPVRAESGRLQFHVVRAVTVTPAKVTARFDVYVDAHTAGPVARRQKLMFAEANVALRVPERSPSYGPRIDAPLTLASVTVDGAQAKTTAAGAIAWSGAPSSAVTLSLVGDLAKVANDAGAEATQAISLDDTVPYVWDASTDEKVDAQLASFVHAGEIREHAKTFAPSLGFLSQPVIVTTNINDICNAYSDGTTINFYKADGNCENTGRIADVVFHEYGHSIHYHAIIEGVGAFEGALSEGQADYVAATFTGDPAMGRGFFFDQSALRHLDPPNDEKRWPEDLDGEPHDDGEIIGQTLWDMRKALVEKLGEAEGVFRSDFLYYQGIRRASDIPSMYVEILAADDDDGDLTNGTPNVCEINHAFGLHGLRAFKAITTTPSVVPPTQQGYDVALALEGLFPGCAEDQIATATLTFHNRATPGMKTTIDMVPNGAALAATIPTQDAGTVVSYGVDIQFADGSTKHFPDNAADPEYEFFVGDVTPIYCETFDKDPFAAGGWTHGLTSGEDVEGADDWSFGPPNGTVANGDPLASFTGENVIGNDLSTAAKYNGLYQSDKVNWARSPKVDVSGYKRVRLQYRRWLNVEDAHFDHARIYANDQVVWENADSDNGDASKVHHQDREWRFHDVDLTGKVAADGTVDLKFEIDSDGGLEMGGWNIDDLCIVAYDQEATCPEGPGLCGEGGGGTGGGSGGDGLGPSPQGGCDCKATSGDLGVPGSAAAFGAALAMLALRRRRARRSR
jgi:hypothetical protein